MDIFKNKYTNLFNDIFTDEGSVIKKETEPEKKR